MAYDGGYSDDFSKSNRAYQAEKQGLFPASKIAKKLGHGCTAAGVRDILEPAEWHHTSKMYNATDYYDLEDAKENFDAIKKASMKENKSKTIINAKIEWLEWGGTRSRPIATEKSADGCTIEYTGGSFCTITFPSGKIMRKKLTTNGFYINGHRPEIDLKY